MLSERRESTIHAMFFIGDDDDAFLRMKCACFGVRHDKINLTSVRVRRIVVIHLLIAKWPSRGESKRID